MVRFDSPVPEIQVVGGEGWIQLKSTADLPYSVPPGLNYRHEQMAAGLRDPIVPEVSTPPKETTSGDGGGVQSGPCCTSTPGNSSLFSSV